MAPSTTKRKPFDWLALHNWCHRHGIPPTYITTRRRGRITPALAASYYRRALTLSPSPQSRLELTIIFEAYRAGQANATSP